MLHIDVRTAKTSCGTATNSAPAPSHTLVHIVAVDDDVQRELTCWLTAAGIDSRTYAHLGAFLNADRADLPGCLIIDAQPPTIRGFEAQAMLLPFVVSCPIVMTGSPLDVSVAVRPMKAIHFVQRPLQEAEILRAVRAALEADREQRLIALRAIELRARYATLSRRERQVMAFVTTGMLNKQIGGVLSLSEITIKAHRGAAMRKMGARSLADLVRMADAIGEEPATRNVRSTPAGSAAVADRRSDCTPVPARVTSFPAEELYRAR